MADGYVCLQPPLPMRTNWMVWIAAWLWLGSSGCGPRIEAGQPVPPHILVILVDDMGYSDLSCYGGEIPTPHIDALAHGGMRMTQFYNAARCCPSRASLLTGLYPHQAGMGHQNRDRGLPAYRGRLGERTVTLAEVLGEKGYATYQVGKWHVGNEAAHWPGPRGFAREFALIEGAMSYYNQWPWVRGQDSLRLTWRGQPYRTEPGFFATDAFSDTAAAWIRQHDFAQPFFMYLAYNAPHWPLHALPEDIARYHGHYDRGWDSLRLLRHQQLIEQGILTPETPLPPRPDYLPAWTSLSDSAQAAWAGKMALYAAVVDRLDQGIGRVVAALRDRGQLEHTLIVFLSDNGACDEDPTGPWSIYPEDGPPGSERSFPSYGRPWAFFSNTPFRLFKSYLHEGGIRTPFIVHFPRHIPAGTIETQAVGHIMDLMPSILDLSGQAYPDSFGGREITPTPGRSLWPVWQGQGGNGHDTLYWEHQFNRALRQGEWKLVSAYRLPDQPPRGHWELYNLRQDPTETQDLAAQYPERVAAMAAAYEAWAQEVGALSRSALDSLAQKP